MAEDADMLARVWDFVSDEANRETLALGGDVPGVVEGRPGGVAKLSRADLAAAQVAVALGGTR